MSICAACGLPGHRYGRNEGVDRFNPQACINMLRGEVDNLTNLLENPQNTRWQEAAWAVADNTDETIFHVYRDGVLFQTCGWQGLADWLVIERPRVVDVAVRRE